jgi:uncharacterized protein
MRIQSPVKLLLMGLIRVYQIVLSPLVNWRGPVCRFHPSCSHYGYDAVKTYGAFKGGGMAAWRVLRCNPWGAGGYDPVPEKHDRKKRNLAVAGESSPSEDTQTSDRERVVGSASGGICSTPAGPTDFDLSARPDPTTLRGA